MCNTRGYEMKKKYYTWQDVERAADSIVAQLAKDEWCPEYIVGINRGGLPLAMLLSHKLDVKMYTVDIQLRDGKDNDCESNLWLAEWAFGYNYPEETGITGARWDPKLRKKILVVDDINDTGATFEWLVKDWQSGCLPDQEYAWDAVWDNSTRFAVMTENLSSNFYKVRYSWDEVNKAEDDVWLVWPWETDNKKGTE